MSYLFGDELSPRGIRTHAVARVLERDWDVDVIGGPAPRRTEAPVVRRSSPVQGLATAISRQLLIDRHEIWSKWRFSFWRPDADFALLVGYPFSPVAAAARRLTQQGIGYVVDAGDPWILTHSDHLRRRIALRRSRRAEHHLWSHAAGAIVTTSAQAASLRRLFPNLPILVRPNGYQPVPEPVVGPPTAAPRVGTRDELRLVHFGRVYAPRVDIAPLMLRLSESKTWPSIVLGQYGDDAEGILRQLPRGVEVEIHDPVPWREALSVARDYDLALVIGNDNPDLLPSKVVEYLTLPIPRVAVVGNEEGGAIPDYVRDKPGWLVVNPAEDDVEVKLAVHCSRQWGREELLPPRGEAWTSVAREIEHFLRECYERSLS